MKEYFHEYSIGEVAKAVGISPELVRYYEKIGLIESIKNDINRYRKFDINLIECLSNIVMLRSLDLSLESIGGVQDSYDDDLARTEKILHARAEEHRRNLEIIRRQLSMTEVLENDLKRIRMQDGDICFRDSPGLVLHGLSDTLDSRELARHYNRLLQGNPGLPKFTFLLDVANLTMEKPWLEKYTRFAISVETPGEHTDDGEFLPGMKCAYSTFTGNEVRAVEEKYGRMLDWIEQQGYVPTNQAIEIGDLNIGEAFLLEIFIPVKISRSTYPGS